MIIVAFQSVKTMASVNKEIKLPFINFYSLYLPGLQEPLRHLCKNSGSLIGTFETHIMDTQQGTPFLIFSP